MPDSLKVVSSPAVARLAIPSRKFLVSCRLVFVRVLRLFLLHQNHREKTNLLLNFFAKRKKKGDGLTIDRF